MKREYAVIALLFCLFFGCVGWIFSGAGSGAVTAGSPATLGSCSGGHSLSASDDMLVCGKLEVDGNAYFDGARGCSFYDDNENSRLGGWIRGEEDSALQIIAYEYEGYGNNNVLIGNDAGQSGQDCGHTTLSSNPTLFIHSNTSCASATNQWLSLTHNQTDGVIDVGTGNVKIDATLAVTGEITGKTKMITKSSAYTIGTDDAMEAYGCIVWASGATTITLPAAVAGMSVMVYSTDNNTKTIDPNGSDGIINDAARDTDGHYIQVDAGIGHFMSVIADSSDGWTLIGRNGTVTSE